MLRKRISAGYLSEQAISEQHGLGITILRTLGNDIDQFHLMVRLAGRQKTASVPVSAHETRSVTFYQSNYPELFLRVMRKLGVDGFDGSSDMIGRYAVQSARSLSRKFRIQGSKWLVCPQGKASLYATHELKTKENIRYATWIMDDHELSGRIDDWRYAWMPEDVMKRHLREASKVFVGSENFQHFYRDRFGVESDVLLSPCAPIGEPVWEDPVGESKPHLAYFGAVFGWQRDPLEILARCARAGRISLDIFSLSDKLPETIKVEGVNIRNSLPPNQVVHEMRKYSAVVVPLSFTERRAYMSYFNIPTKLSECLASGTIVVLLGPSEGASMSLVRDAGAGLTITTQQVHRVCEQLEVLRDAAWRRETLKNARQLITNYLNPETMNRVWKEGWNSF